MYRVLLHIIVCELQMRYLQTQCTVHHEQLFSVMLKNYYLTLKQAIVIWPKPGYGLKKSCHSIMTIVSWLKKLPKKTGMKVDRLFYITIFGTKVILTNNNWLDMTLCLAQSKNHYLKLRDHIFLVTSNMS